MIKAKTIYTVTNGTLQNGEILIEAGKIKHVGSHVDAPADARQVGTWHSLNRYVLFPPGASFLMLNVSPNPSEVVDHNKKFGVFFEVDF